MFTAGVPAQNGLMPDPGCPLQASSCLMAWEVRTGMHDAHWQRAQQHTARSKDLD